MLKKKIFPFRKKSNHLKLFKKKKKIMMQCQESAKALNLVVSFQLKRYPNNLSGT